MSNKTVTEDFDSNTNIFKSDMFKKLPNPLEYYLRKFPECDGMNAEKLLEFISILLLLKEECNLRCREILQLSVNYAKDPLRSKLINGLKHCWTLDTIHTELISTYLPIAQLEYLKLKLVLRPQRGEETLFEYVKQIKKNSKILLCSYSENQIVHLIALGMNEKCKSKLVFSKMPQSYEDLDNLMRQLNNVEYYQKQSDNMLCAENTTPHTRTLHKEFQVVTHRKRASPFKCYSCNRYGHMARDCRGEISRSNGVKKIKEEEIRCVPEYVISNEIINNMGGALPSVELCIGDKFNQKVLIDSGSTLNIIDWRLYHRLRKLNLINAMKECKIKCRGANNAQVVILGNSSMKIKIERFTWEIDVFVGKNITRKCILGVPFLKKTNCVLNVGCNYLYFSFAPKIKIALCEEKEDCLDLMLNNTEIGVKEEYYDLGLQRYVNYLLTRYNNVFTTKIGKALDFEVDLKLKDTSPIRFQYYPMTPPQTAAMKLILDDLESQEIIEHRSSEFASPAFLVSKPGTDKYRLVINYSELNKKIERINYPIGLITDLVEHLGEAKWFTVLDLTQAFYQVRLSEKCQHLTAFTTPFGSYVHKTVPYGLSVGSGIMSKLLNEILSDIKYKFVLNYIDDLVIYSNSLQEHKEHVKVVLERLAAKNLTVNPEKGQFFKKEIKYLGYLVGNNMVKIDPDRTSSLLNCPVPKNGKQVSKYLGMVGYLQHFIKDYATIAAPLNELRRKRNKFIWTSECQSSFEKLKELIMNPSNLAIPNFNYPFQLHCDSSYVAAGAVLSQKINGVDRPVYFYSKKYSDAEKQLSIYQKECLSVVLAIQKFNKYLRNKAPYELFVDNAALKFILSHFRKLGKIARWAEILMGIPFKINHVSSGDNKIADYLSRMFEEKQSENGEVPDVVEYCTLSNTRTEDKRKKKEKVSEVNNTRKGMRNHEMFNLSAFPVVYQKIPELQEQDEVIRNIIDNIKAGNESKKFQFHKRVLFYVNAKNQRKIYLPSSLLPVVFSYMHQELTGLHQGVGKTIKRASQHFYHPSLSKYIRENVSKCEECQRAKPNYKPTNGELKSSYSKSPLKRIYVDTCGPIVGNGTYTYILIAVDHLTKYVWLFPLRKCSSKEIIACLEDIFKNFSLCCEIISDNAKYFTSNEMSEFLFNLGITQKTIAAYHPCANLAERYLRNLKHIFQIYYSDNKKNWPTQLGTIQRTLNSGVSESTKYSAHELMFSFQPNDSLSNVWDLNSLLQERINPEEAKDKLKEAVQNNEKRNKGNEKLPAYNKIKAEFQPGCLVYLSNKGRPAMQGNVRFADNYVGPYVIVYCLTDNSFILQSPTDNLDCKRAHVSQLKKANV